MVVFPLNNCSGTPEDSGKCGRVGEERIGVYTGRGSVVTIPTMFTVGGQLKIVVLPWHKRNQGIVLEAGWRR